MAQHASALKEMRRSARRRARNRMDRSRLKTQVKKLRTALEAGDAETARQLLPETASELDRAAKKGVIHDNTAARSKSRLASQVSALAARS